MRLAFGRCSLFFVRRYVRAAFTEGWTFFARAADFLLGLPVSYHARRRFFLFFYLARGGWWTRCACLLPELRRREGWGVWAAIDSCVQRGTGALLPG